MVGPEKAAEAFVVNLEAPPKRLHYGNYFAEHLQSDENSTEGVEAAKEARPWEAAAVALLWPAAEDLADAGTSAVHHNASKLESKIYMYSDRRKLSSDNLPGGLGGCWGGNPP